MLRCQFLCHVLKALFFIKIALELSYLCKKMQNFRALGAPPPNPQPLAAGGFTPKPPLASSGWGSAPRPTGQPPHCEFLATRLGVHLSAGLHQNSGKKVLQFWRRSFFALHLICSIEKNRGRGSSPPI